MYCKTCGAEINDKAVICVKCGCQVSGQTCCVEKDPSTSEKNGVATLLLCFFLGFLGVHSFYVGRTGAGLGQLFTAGGCGVWVLIDFIMILVGSYKDSEGKFVKLQ